MFQSLDENVHNPLTPNIREQILHLVPVVFFFLLKYQQNAPRVNLNSHDLRG